MGSLERNFIEAEVNQCREEGRDVGAIAERVKAAFEGQPDQAELEALYDELCRRRFVTIFRITSHLNWLRFERHGQWACVATQPRWIATPYQKTYGGWLAEQQGVRWVSR